VKRQKKRRPISLLCDLPGIRTVFCFAYVYRGFKVSIIRGIRFVFEGYDFYGIVISQNCASAKRYLIGEPAT
jgi:hypothetical protein